jgi:hypothetical protein
MDWNRLAPYLLRYSVVGGVTLAALYAAAWLADVPFVPVALVAFLVGLLAFSLLAGASDVGMDAVTMGAEAGFSAGDPTQSLADRSAVPARGILALYAAGVAAWGLLGVVVAY